MKRLMCLIIGVCLAFFTSYVAAFTYEYRGQTLDYTYVSGVTCKVTAGDYVKGGNQISGDLYIPSHVVNDGKELTVVSIGEYAFYENSNLISVEIPNTVTEIDNSAFCRCDSLSTIKMSDEIVYLDRWCFAFCSQLVQVSLPETLRGMGEYCFWGCSNLQSINIPSLESIPNNCFGACKKLNHIILPENIKDIGNKSFYGCPLSDLELPANITRLGESCFELCSNLKKIIIPNSVKSIGDRCFANTGLESIELPSSLYSVGSLCFYNCDSLKNVSVKASNIGTDCFYGCKLESLYLDGNLCYSKYDYQHISTDTLIIGPNISRLILATYVPSDGYSSPRYEPLLSQSPKKIIIEDSDKELQIGWIKNSSGSDFESYFVNSPSFRNWASGVTDLYLGRTLVGCLMETSSLESITLGPLLRTFNLGGNLSILSAVYKLKYLNSLNPIPPIIGPAFPKQYQTVKVKVPTESLALYKDSPVWNKFTDLMVDIPTSIDYIITDFDAETPTEIYDLKGIKVADCVNSLPTGIYIARSGKRVKKIAMK